jgi:hypothetical protein
MLRRCAGRTELFADAPAPDDIGPVFAAKAGHGVDEREGIDREPEARELLAQRFESRDLVAELRRALELQSLARVLHRGAQRVDGGVMCAFEELSRQRESRVVLCLGRAGDARPEAPSDFMPDAPRGSRRREWHLGLVGEIHLHVEPAVA